MANGLASSGGNSGPNVEIRAVKCAPKRAPGWPSRGREPAPGEWVRSLAGTPGRDAGVPPPPESCYTASAMPEYRLGDEIDDYCVKCKRITNHSIVSLVNAEPAKVRCRSCYHDHNYIRCEIPPSKKDLKKQALFNEVLAQVNPAETAPAAETVEAAEAAAEAAPAKTGRKRKS